jgi:hypothetical protein
VLFRFATILLQKSASCRLGYDYNNTSRQDSSLGYKTPAAYAGALTAPKGVTSVEALTATG